MTKKLTIFSFCILHFALVQAQQYKWIKGGGSTSSMQTTSDEEKVITVITDDNRNIYALAIVGDHNIRADTFFKAIAYNPGTSTPKRQILFMSYDCNGNMRFAKLIESYNSTFGMGLAYNTGKVYVAADNIGNNKHIGSDATPTSQYQTIALMKYDTSGAYEWIRFAGPDILSTFQATSAQGTIAIDGQGNIHQYNYIRSGVQLTSTVLTQTGNYDLTYDVNGNLLNAVRMPVADTNYFIQKVQFDKQSGKRYATFFRADATVYSQDLLIAYDNSGNQLWKDTITLGCALNGFRLIPGDGIYIAGYGGGTYTFTLGGLSVSNSSSAFGAFSTITKLDTNGIAKWIRKVEGTTATMILGDLEVLPNYNIASLGHFSGKAKYGMDSITSTTGEGVNPFFFIVDTSGKLKKMDQLHGAAFYDYGMCMTADKIGNVYIGGEVGTTITATGLSTYSSNGGNSDFYIMKYGYDCSCIAAPNSNFTFTATSGSKTVPFSFTGTTPVDSVVWDFGDGNTIKQTSPSHTYTSFGSYTVCATVYTQCGSNQICKTVQVTTGIGGIKLEGISIYPNPVSNQLVVDGVEKGYRIILTDITGKRLIERIANDKKEVINTDELWVGIYLVQISDDKGRKMTTTIIKQ